MSIFRSPEAKDALVAWHHRFRERIARPTESRVIDTPFGDTHVLVAGPADGPPLVLFHGALASSAHALSVVPSLADRFRVYAVDVVGQSPLSAETRPDVSGNAYGEWAQACLQRLGLTRTAVLGVSWGGFVACRLASVAPQSIAVLSLVVPAGIVSGYGWEPVAKVALPMLLCRIAPSRRNFERFASAQLTVRDPLWVEYLGEALRTFKVDFRAPRNLRSGELDRFRAPVQVIAAEKDIMFPGERLLRRAREVFPNLQETHLLDGARHSPSTTPEAGRALANTIATFLERHLPHAGRDAALSPASARSASA